MQNDNGILSLYSDVVAEQVNWLWYPFIAYGKITLLQGDPGDGKSTMMLHIIAQLSVGGKTPDGEEIGLSKKVIYQCSEDGLADTIKPRLVSAGADCRKIAFIKEDSGLTLDDERIRDAIISFKPKLVVIDPVQAYLQNDADLQMAGRARRLMRRLGMWAEMYHCAIVLIGHMNKKEGSKDLYRGLGSIDVIAAARSVLQVEKDEEDPDIRIVKQIKNSLAPVGGEIRYEIRRETGFRWLNQNATTQMDMDQKENVAETKSEKAARLIQLYLSEGDMSSNEIYIRLAADGISHRTAENVKDELGIRTYRKMRRWYWSINPLK